MTIEYSKLRRYQDKTAGKNNSEVDGFYFDQAGEKFFIKKPADKKELFTELLAGLCLKAMMDKELIPKEYHPSLICAGVIQVKPGEYALIQDVAEFTELHRLIGTSYRDGSDRNPLIEMLRGPSSYPALIQGKEYFGLSMALMCSLLLGANSVHSGNIVRLNNQSDDSSHQFARLDWGDAFRHFCDPENNTDVLVPKEYKGALNVKRFTKGYIANFKQCKGLFPAIADKARVLQENIPSGSASAAAAAADDSASTTASTDFLKSIMIDVLKQIPADLIDAQTQAELAVYLSSTTLNSTTFGEEGRVEDFAKELAGVMQQRLAQLVKLQDPAASSENRLYESHMPQPPQPKLKVTEDLNFPDQVFTWIDQLQGPDIDVQGLDIDVQGVEIDVMAAKLNAYVDAIAHQTDMVGLWPSANQNCLVDFKPDGSEQAQYGYAFINQMRESTILRLFFKVFPDGAGSQRPKHYETALDDYCQQHSDSDIGKIRALLTEAQNIVNQIQQIQVQKKRCENSDISKGDIEEALKMPKQQLRIAMERFKTAKEQADAVFADKTQDGYNEVELSAFYPLTPEQLQALSDHQLVTLCLQEAELMPHTSTLLVTVLTNQALYERFSIACQSDEFQNRQDNIGDKVRWLAAQHRLVIKYADQRDLAEKALAVAKAENAVLQATMAADAREGYPGGSAPPSPEAVPEGEPGSGPAPLGHAASPERDPSASPDRETDSRDSAQATSDAVSVQRAPVASISKDDLNKGLKLKTLPKWVSHIAAALFVITLMASIGLLIATSALSPVVGALLLTALVASVTYAASREFARPQATDPIFAPIVNDTKGLSVRTVSTGPRSEDQAKPEAAATRDATPDGESDSPIPLLGM